MNQARQEGKRKRWKAIFLLSFFPIHLSHYFSLDQLLYFILILFYRRYLKTSTIFL